MARMWAATLPKVSYDRARRAGGPRRVDDQRDVVLLRLADVERGATPSSGNRVATNELGAAEELLALALAQPRVDRHRPGARSQHAGVERDHEVSGRWGA